MRVVIAEDSVLLRAGLTRILADAGEEVVATVGAADELMAAVERLKNVALDLSRIREQGIEVVEAFRHEPSQGSP